MLAGFKVNLKTDELTCNRSNVSSAAPICVLFEHE